MSFLENIKNYGSNEVLTSDSTSGWSFLSRPNSINSDNAQKIADVFGCINIKANALAIMPINLYMKVDNGKKIHDSHSLYRLLRKEPNPRLTAFEWKKMISQDLDLRGKHYAQIIKDGMGRTKAIYPLVADYMKVQFAPDGKSKIYTYNGIQVPENRILHLIDIPDKYGLDGISRIQYAKETLEFSSNASKYGNKLFENGITPSGAFTQPAGSKLSDESFERLKKELEEKYIGLERTGKPLILEDGLEFKAISLNNSDSQWLESRKLNREQIATIFGVPSAMLNDTANTAYNNLEQKYLEFQTGTILPITIAIEEKCEQKLLMDFEKENMSIKFKFNALLRVDAKSRGEFYKAIWGVGALSPNEIRELEDMNQYEGGNEYFVQTSYSTVKNILKAKDENIN